MGLSLLTPPAVELLTLDEAKLHLRVNWDDEDTLIAALIAAAREWVEEETGRALITQSWRLVLDRFDQRCHGACTDQIPTYARAIAQLYPQHAGPDAAIHLPRPTLQSVTAVTYVDASGVTQTWSPSNYVVDTGALPGRIRLAYGASWPAVRYQPNAVTIDYVAGYGDSAEDVPNALRAAMLLRLGDLYVNREAQVMGVTVTPNATLAALLAPYLYREAV